MLSLAHPDGYLLTDDPARLDVDRVHRWLCTDAYWALDRPRAVLVRAIAGSTAYGLYRSDGAQVAFARVVTDGALFSYLCDVYVDRSERGRGLGTWLIGAIRDEWAARGLRRMLLVTDDAQGVYERVGFTAVAAHRWMETDLQRTAGAAGPVTSATVTSPPVTSAISKERSVSGPLP